MDKSENLEDVWVLCPNCRTPLDDLRCPTCPADWSHCLWMQAVDPEALAYLGAPTEEDLAEAIKIVQSPEHCAEVERRIAPYKEGAKRSRHWGRYD